MDEPSQFRRTPGKIADRRCEYPVVAWLVPLAFEAMLPRQTPARPQIIFALSLIPAALWIRALVSLLRVWHDPSARGIRAGASLLLFAGFYPCMAAIFICDFFLPALRNSN